MEKSSNSWPKRYLNYPYWKSINNFVQGVASLEPLLVILFGSVAKGEFTQYSDADVLVIFPEVLDWLKIYEFSDGIVQPLVKSLGEIKRHVEEGNTFTIESLEDGVLLYGKEEIYRDLLNRVKDFKDRLGLIREKGGWRKVISS